MPPPLNLRTAPARCRCFLSLFSAAVANLRAPGAFTENLTPDPGLTPRAIHLSPLCGSAWCCTRRGR